MGRSRAPLAAAITLGLVVQIAYAIAIRHHALAGDAPEYDAEARLIAAGHLFWTRVPYGILHAGAWKAPLYPAWVGLWYSVVGPHPLVVELAQTVVGISTIPLTHRLADRLFGPRVAIVAAFVVAVYPLAWQFDGLLYPESLATPLYLGLLTLMLTGEPGRRRAAGFGLLMGVALLLRPTSEFLLLGALLAWGMRTGWRRGAGLVGIAVLAAAMVVAPWTIRNAVVMHGFVPISMQDSAIYGTFNATAAADPVYPFAWRKEPPSVTAYFRHPMPDVELRAKLIAAGTSYIGAHPASLLEAFFWNGLSRLWDVRRPSRALAEVPFEGRSHAVTLIGLLMYYLLLPLALIGLWRARARRWLICAILATALGASIVFTIDAGTRYRAPLEPLIVILAGAGITGPGASRYREHRR